jgi:hypothetical protein
MARVAALLLLAPLVPASLHAGEATNSAPPKPAVLELRHDSETVSYRVKVNPGVPGPGTTATVEVEVAELLATPDPDFGDRKPIDDAELTAYLVELPDGKRRRKKPGWIDGRWAVKLADPGTWGFTFTPPAKGVYGFYLRGKNAAGGTFDYGTYLPVGVWPMPEGRTQNDSPPALPTRLPDATTGNLPHGKAICAERCRTDLDGAQPKGDAPAFLSSAFAASRSNAAATCWLCRSRAASTQSSYRSGSSSPP